MSCVLAVDIGNTSTSVAIARNCRILRFSHYPSNWKTGATVAAVVRRAKGQLTLDGSLLCSVVPRCNGVWLRELRKAALQPPILVNHEVKLDVGISYPRPATIGADRLANACGAVARHGAPVIVADFGTALTFDVVSNKGDYVGGVIAPGLPLMTQYLHEKTALLPSIELMGSHGSIGRSTEEAMRIGARVGYAGMVREITNLLKKQPGMASATLCATGGYAKWAIGGLKMGFLIEPDLTLYGLARIFELNRADS